MTGKSISQLLLYMIQTICKIVIYHPSIILSVHIHSYEMFNILLFIYNILKLTLIII